MLRLMRSHTSLKKCAFLRVDIRTATRLKPICPRVRNTIQIYILETWQRFNNTTPGKFAQCVLPRRRCRDAVRGGSEEIKLWRTRSSVKTDNAKLSSRRSDVVGGVYPRITIARETVKGHTARTAEFVREQTGHFAPGCLQRPCGVHLQWTRKYLDGKRFDIL